jgi:hypothetical protein
MLVLTNLTKQIHKKLTQNLSDPASICTPHLNKTLPNSRPAIEDFSHPNRPSPFDT